MNKRGESDVGSTNLLTVLLAVFIALKLAKVVSWSWWIVFSPLWIEIGIVLLMLLFFWMNDDRDPWDKWRY